MDQNNTTSVCIGNTVFIKQKYMIMLSVTTFNALMKTTEDLTTALDGNILKTIFNQ